MRFYPVTSTSDSSTVDATARAIGSMVSRASYLFVSSTNCWIKQGQCKLVTCATQANMAEGDYVSITHEGSTVVYEFDVAPDGVVAGRVVVDISAATTAAEVAAALVTAIDAEQPDLEVTDNADGTITICAPNRTLAITENVAHASFTVAAAVVTVSAADGSTFVPALYPVLLNGDLGPNVGVVRNSADGIASLTRVQVEG